MSKKANVGLALIVLVVISGITHLWPKLFPRTEVVILNATEKELRNAVVEMPGESVSFGNIPAGDFAVKRIQCRAPEAGFRPSQRGTLADGTEIQSHALSGGERVAIVRAVYTVRPDGSQWAKIQTSGK